MFENIKPFVGIVEDIFDPDNNGRARVRIFGVHTFDETLLPTESLPWSIPLMPVHNASTAGFGWSATGLMRGAHVIGFATDPAYQDTFIAFSWPGDSSLTGADTNPLTNGQVVTAIERQLYNSIKDVKVKEDTGEEQPLPPEPEEGYDPEKWMEVARKEIGVKEYSGKLNNNPRIIEYHKTTSLGASSDEVSWCASFVGWVLIQSGFQSTKSALARSYLKWGYPLSEPRHGAVVVFRRGNNPTFGHVGFVDKFDAQYIYCLGGNQSNQVKVSRYKRNTVLGYRWPTPKTTVAAKPTEQNGTWSEPIPDRTPVEMPAPAPSGEPADQFMSRSVPEPAAGGTMYPMNSVFTSRSGHIMEVDDTPNGERIHYMHMSGSYFQYLPDGDVVQKSVKDAYHITQFNWKGFVGGDYNQTVVGTTVCRFGGEVYHVHQGNYSNVTNGTALLKSTGVIEIQTADLVRLLGQAVEIAQKLRVPVIEADTIRCNNLSVANTIDGNAKYADSAGRAPTRGGASPASPEPVPEIVIEPSLEDNGGNFGGESGAKNARAAKTSNTSTTKPQTTQSASEGIQFPSFKTLPSAQEYTDVVVLHRPTGSRPSLVVSDGEKWEKLS